MNPFAARVGNLAEAVVVQRSSLLPATEPARGTVWLSTAARGGGLWLGVAALLAVRPGRGRAAALDGLTALGLANGLTHLAKHLVHRPRPPARWLPARRALPEPLASSSLPSAHTASAAAFTTAAVLGCPPLGPLLVPLAACVGYGRVRTRAHWPTDVLAGAAAGAAAGAVVHRLRARRSRRNRAPALTCAGEVRVNGAGAG